MKQYNKPLKTSRTAATLMLAEYESGSSLKTLSVTWSLNQSTISNAIRFYFGERIRKRGFGGFTPHLKKEFARRGGRAVAQDRDHMSRIGKLGGTSVSADTEYMARIGKRGGLNSRKNWVRK